VLQYITLLEVPYFLRKAGKEVGSLGEKTTSTDYSSSYYFNYQLLKRYWICFRLRFCLLVLLMVSTSLFMFSSLVLLYCGHKCFACVMGLWENHILNIRGYSETAIYQSTSLPIDYSQDFPGLQLIAEELRKILLVYILLINWAGSFVPLS